MGNSLTRAWLILILGVGAATAAPPADTRHAGPTGTRPSSTSAPASPPRVVNFQPGSATIVLDAAGHVQLDGRAVTLAELAQELAGSIQEQPGIRLRVSLPSDGPPDRERALRGLLADLDVPEQAVTFSRSAAGAARRHDPRAITAYLQGLTSKPAPPLPPERADSLHQLADDLQNRAIATRLRAEAVAEVVKQIALDLRGIFNLSRSPRAVDTPPGETPLPPVTTRRENATQAR